MEATSSSPALTPRRASGAAVLAVVRKTQPAVAGGLAPRTARGTGGTGTGATPRPAVTPRRPASEAAAPAVLTSQPTPAMGSDKAKMPMNKQDLTSLPPYEGLESPPQRHVDATSLTTATHHRRTPSISFHSPSYAPPPDGVQSASVGAKSDSFLSGSAVREAPRIFSGRHQSTSTLAPQSLSRSCSPLRCSVAAGATTPPPPSAPVTQRTPRGAFLTPTATTSRAATAPRKRPTPPPEEVSLGREGVSSGTKRKTVAKACKATSEAPSTLAAGEKKPTGKKPKITEGSVGEEQSHSGATKGRRRNPVTPRPVHKNEAVRDYSRRPTPSRTGGTQPAGVSMFSAFSPNKDVDPFSAAIAAALGDPSARQAAPNTGVNSQRALFAPPPPSVTAAPVAQPTKQRTMSRGKSKNNAASQTNSQRQATLSAAKGNAVSRSGDVSLTVGSTSPDCSTGMPRRPRSGSCSLLSFDNGESRLAQPHDTLEAAITTQMLRSPNLTRSTTGSTNSSFARTGVTSILAEGMLRSPPGPGTMCLFQSHRSLTSGDVTTVDGTPVKPLDLSTLRSQPTAIFAQPEEPPAVRQTEGRRPVTSRQPVPVVKRPPTHLLKRTNSDSAVPVADSKPTTTTTTTTKVSPATSARALPSFQLSRHTGKQSTEAHAPTKKIKGGEAPAASNPTDDARMASLASLSSSIPPLPLRELTPDRQPPLATSTSTPRPAFGTDRPRYAVERTKPNSRTASRATTPIRPERERRETRTPSKPSSPPPAPYTPGRTTTAVPGASPVPHPITGPSPPARSMPPGAPPVTVTGVAYGFDVTRATWETMPVQLTIVNGVRLAGRDDMFFYYAAERRTSLADGNHNGHPSPPTAAVVKVFRPDIMGVVAEADYFAQMECQCVAACVARAWDRRMASQGASSAASQSPSTRPYVLPSVGPFLQTGRRLIRIDAASVTDGLRACSTEADPTGDLSFFARTTADSESLLCILEDGSFVGFPERPVTARGAPSDSTATPRSGGTAKSSQPQATPRGTAGAMITKSRPRAATGSGESPPAATMDGYVPADPMEMNGAKLTKLADALAHLSYQESQNTLVLMGLREGCCRYWPPTDAGNAVHGGRDGNSYRDPFTGHPVVLTDPLVHSALKMPRTKGVPRALFGRTNGGSRYLESFQRTHVCNEYCGVLALAKPATPSAKRHLTELTDSSSGSRYGAVGVKSYQLPQVLVAPGTSSTLYSPEVTSLLLCLRQLRERIPIESPQSPIASAQSSPKKANRPAKDDASSKRPAGTSNPTRPPSVVDFCGGILYCFDREGCARWQPSKVTVQLDLAERPTAPVSDAEGRGFESRFVTFHGKVKCEDPFEIVPGEEDTRQIDGSPATQSRAPANGKASPSGAPAERRPVRMRFHVFPLHLATHNRNDEAYFMAAGERTYLEEIIVEYNRYIKEERPGRQAQLLSCKPCAVIRINRNKVRATLIENPDADDGRERNIIDFYSTDSKDVMLLAEPVDEDGVAMITSHYVGNGDGPSTGLGAVYPTSAVGRTVEQPTANLPSAEVVRETKRVFEAFCDEDAGSGLVILKHTRITAPTPGRGSKSSGSPAVATSQGRGTVSAPLPVLDVSVDTVLVNTAVTSVSALGDRILFLEERLAQYHVYTALKYAFNFYKLKWQPLETFICVPSPEKGIGSGTYRVCFEVLELPRRRKPKQRYVEGFNIQREMALNSARGPGGLAGLSALPSAGDDGAPHSTPSDLSVTPGAPSLTSDEHSAFVSPSMPRLDINTSPLPAGAHKSVGASGQTARRVGVPNSNYSGPLASQTGTWTANVAKMFRRNGTAAAGLPITERNYFFEAAKQNYCACVARDFNQKLAQRAAAGLATPRTARGTGGAVGVSGTGGGGGGMMTSRTIKHMNSGHGVAAASPRQWQYSTSGNSPYPQLWFIPESVVTLRYDVDLPYHLCHARRGFFSYRCTEIRKHKPELFEEASGFDGSPMASTTTLLGPPDRNGSASEHRGASPAVATRVPSVAAIRRTAAVTGGAGKSSTASTAHMQCMTFTLEPKLDGQFSKYTSNDERVFYTNEVPLNARDHEMRRQIVKCAEALAHFSWEESSGGLLVCDLQGVGTALTDPEIHTINDGDDDDDGDDADALAATYDKMLALDGTLNDKEDSGELFAQTALYLAGNGGRAGIDLFLSRHRCTEVCEAAGLQPPREVATTSFPTTTGPLQGAGRPVPSRAALVAPAGYGSAPTRTLELQMERPRNRYLLTLQGTHMAAQML